VTPDLLTCDAAAERGLVERYVAGRLDDEAELAAFEAHLLTCERCRDEVRLGLTVRAELAVSGRRRGRRVWPFGVGLALAAGIAALVLLRFNSEGVRAFGDVQDPPLYLGVAVRGAPTPAESLFEAAMTAYSRGDYGAAAAGLERALASGTKGDSVPALFFLGASRLLTGRPAAAADALQRAISLGDSPYLPEAHYYLAKALLREGNAAAALRELQAVPAADSAVAALAVALADSVRGGGLSKR
jgi:tetratricopeptide (TPR) repeat protein